jgi:hypothetical protein
VSVLEDEEDRLVDVDFLSVEVELDELWPHLEVA